MKILLLGRSGLLGSAIHTVFSKASVECYSPTHGELDVTDERAVGDYFSRVVPDFVINATGYTAVDKAESDPLEAKKAELLNVTAPALLAKAALTIHVPFVHMSTDYVFDGRERRSPYTELDGPNPLSIYGKTKRAGEEVVLSTSPQNLIVRTAWPFGPGGKNFLDTIISRSIDSDRIEVVNDQVGSPTYTLDFALALLKLLESKASGVYHVVNSGQASWYELAAQAYYLLGIPREIVPITTEKLSRPAPRPSYSVLANTRTLPLRSWQDALEHYLMRKQVISRA